MPDTLTFANFPDFFIYFSRVRCVWDGCWVGRRKGLGSIIMFIYKSRLIGYPECGYGVIFAIPCFCYSFVLLCRLPRGGWVSFSFGGETHDWGPLHT